MPNIEMGNVFAAAIANDSPATRAWLTVLVEVLDGDAGDGPQR